jgi:hypothetical protein
MHEGQVSVVLGIIYILYSTIRVGRKIPSPIRVGLIQRQFGLSLQHNGGREGGREGGKEGLRSILTILKQTILSNDPKANDPPKKGKKKRTTSSPVLHLVTHATTLVPVLVSPEANATPMSATLMIVFENESA